MKFEIVVVDDGSTDATPLVLQDFKQAHAALSVRLVRQCLNCGISTARHVGVTEAHGRNILLTDSDCLVHPDWATHFVKALNLPGIVAAAGSVIEPPPRNIAERAFHGTSRIGRVVGQSRDLVGNNTAEQFRRAEPRRAEGSVGAIDDGNGPVSRCLNFSVFFD